MTMTDDPFLATDHGAVAPAMPPPGFDGSEEEWNTRVDLAACTGSSPTTGGTI